MGERNPKVDEFLESAPRWREEMAALRGILLSCGLEEELKWGAPCYVDQGKNVVDLLPLNRTVQAAHLRSYSAGLA